MTNTPNARWRSPREHGTVVRVLQDIYTGEPSQIRYVPMHNPAPASAAKRRSAFRELDENDGFPVRPDRDRDPDGAAVGQLLVDDSRRRVVSAGPDAGDQGLDVRHPQVHGEDAGVVRGALGARPAAWLLVLDELDLGAIGALDDDGSNARLGDPEQGRDRDGIVIVVERHLEPERLGIERQRPAHVGHADHRMKDPDDRHWSRLLAVWSV